MSTNNSNVKCLESVNENNSQVNNLKKEISRFRSVSVNVAKYINTYEIVNENDDMKNSKI